MKKAIFSLIFSLLIISCSKNERSEPDDEKVIKSARYFDAMSGNDNNDGLTSLTAWKTLDTINSLVWGPGSEILLKGGSEWSAQLDLKGSGDALKSAKLSGYGSGAMPVINGEGKSYVIKIENQQFWEISNLEITNFDSDEEGKSLDEWESENETHWAQGESLPPYTVSRKDKFGILVQATDFGEVSGLHFVNLEIHGINGNITSKDNGGIFLEITGNIKPTWFKDLLIENCYIHNVDRTGISNQSSWSTRSYEANTNWKPSRIVVIRNNRFELTGANALIVRVSESPLMEFNLFDHCAIKESGNASFSFNCDNALWQHNEARYTKYNEGDADAGGFDSDYRCKNTIIRYNYSHDNEYGGVLVCCQGGDTRFNVGTQVCYNLFVNNSDHVFRVSGTPDETIFFNNVVFNSQPGSLDVIWHKNWAGYPTGTSYLNNIFYLNSSTGNVELSSSTLNSFSTNIFFGNFSGDLPGDRFTFDPGFSGGDLSGSPLPEAFSLKIDSPSIDAGTAVPSCPAKDYFGNTITDKSKPDIGINEMK